MIKHFRVSSRINFTLQNLLSTGNSKRCHLAAKFFPRTLNFLLRFSLGCADDGISFGTSLLFGRFNDLGTALFAVGDNRRGTCTGFGLNFLAFSLSFSKSDVALVGSCKKSNF